MILKRFMRGLPFSIPMPVNSILVWDTQQRQISRPLYSLEGLQGASLLTARTIVVEKLKDLLHLERFPKNFPGTASFVERTSLTKVIREKWLLETEPGLKIPFYLLIPKNRTGRLPVILVLHGHSAGKIETAGILPSYHNGNALALAEAGYITAAPDFRGFGELGWTGNWDDSQGHAYGKNIHVQDVLNNLERGRTVLGTYLYDLDRLLGYLKTRSEVDPKQIGVAGTSMGADIAIWFAALNPEIRAIAASHPPILDEPLKLSAQNPAHACTLAIPDLTSFFDPATIPLLVAPAAMLISYNDGQQSNYNFERIRKFYGVNGHSNKVDRVVRHSGGENFDNARAIEWFKKWL